MTTPTMIAAPSGTVRADVVPRSCLTLLVWTCRCHGWAYSHPSCCLHTSRENLIPPPELKRHNVRVTGREPAKGERR